MTTTSSPETYLCGSAVVRGGVVRLGMRGGGLSAIISWDGVVLFKRKDF